MVLLAAAICTKQGKALLSRQFVAMSRSRIEGLLASFPKLINTGKQHTFVETDSVRYVYQPLEQLYMLLITTKSSNILEDLETLRLFSRLIPEYCHTLDERDVLDNCFELIFAFDEIIALGYRESVNLAQIRTFTEMDSHEERVYEAMRKSQEREAKDVMKRKAKELQQAKREGRKAGHGMTGIGGGGGAYGSSGFSPVDYKNPGSFTGMESSDHTSSRSTYQPSRPTASNAMKLGKKTKDVEKFVDKLISEGDTVTSVSAPRQSAAVKTTPAAAQSPVHLKIAETLSVTAGRDGGLQNMEVIGMMTLRIIDPQYCKIYISVDNREKRNAQLQTHPNVDKRTFNQDSIITLKGEGRTFPTGQDIGVLKWRLQTTDDSLIPLFINCWPSENQGTCDVNVEYELYQDYLELNDVVISIPVPSGVGSPVVGEIDGEYHYDTRKHILEWCIPVVDATNKTGSLEFSIPGCSNDFFPVRVSFTSPRSYCHIKVSEVLQVEDKAPVKFSTDVSLAPDKYEVV